MTRHVYAGRQVAHIWAQDIGADARSHNGQFYCEHNAIYSYGSHFQIARFVTAPASLERVVLATTRSYSVTTSQHQGMALGALRAGRPVFMVERPERTNWSDMLASIIADATAEHAKAMRARGNREWRLANALATLQQAREFARHFGLPDPAPEGATDNALSTLAATLAEQYRIAAAQAAVDQAALAERHRLEREQMLPLAIAEWRGGATYGEHYRWLGEAPTMLRLKADGETVETSRGATFPADDARKAWPLLKWARYSQQTVLLSDARRKLGHFTVDAIEADGTVVAGCHRVPWSECVALAVKLGLSVEGCEPARAA